jgi:hypothetical protein
MIKPEINSAFGIKNPISEVMAIAGKICHSHPGGFVDILALSFD